MAIDLHTTLIPNYIVSDANLGLVLEAPGFDEFLNHKRQMEIGKVGMPAVGPSGNVLTKCCEASGIDRYKDVYIGNIVRYVLPNNNFKNVGIKAEEVKELVNKERKNELDFHIPPYFGEYFRSVLLSPIAPGVYLPFKFWSELLNLWKEIHSVSPKILIPMGNSALWATCGKSGIAAARGSWLESLIVDKNGKHIPCIPTYHPAAATYKGQWSKTIYITADLKKAASYVGLQKEQALTKVNVFIPENYGEYLDLYNKYIAPFNTIAIDIETPLKRKSQFVDYLDDEDKLDPDKWPPQTDRSDRFIDTIGFCGENNEKELNSIVLPFMDWRRMDGCFYSYEDHLLIMEHMVKNILINKNKIKLFQNGGFDTQYIMDMWGVVVINYRHDTRLLHHSLYPSEPKSLAAMSATYLHLPSWKFLHKMEGKRDG